MWWTCSEWSIWKDVKGSSRGLICRTAPTFGEGTEKSHEMPVRTVCAVPKFRTRHFANTDIARLCGFNSRNFGHAVFKKVETWNSKVFERYAKFFVAGMKAQGDEGGGRILLGDNTGCGAVMLRPIRLHCVGVRISTALLCVHIHSRLHEYTILTRKIRLALDFNERQYCARRVYGRYRSNQLVRCYTPLHCLARSNSSICIITLTVRGQVSRPCTSGSTTPLTTQ